MKFLLKMFEMISCTIPYSLSQKSPVKFDVKLKT